mmetsp:Transcript_32490/g.103106  ORF Transcript_32490/g.103106 Transcript_32490/m.103106 type:complete len:288 (+) Transcript_32490:1379-2242(+)
MFRRPDALQVRAPRALPTPCLSARRGERVHSREACCHVRGVERGAPWYRVHMLQSLGGHLPCLGQHGGLDGAAQALCRQQPTGQHGVSACGVRQTQALGAAVVPGLHQAVCPAARQLASGRLCASGAQCTCTWHGRSVLVPRQRCPVSGEFHLLLRPLHRADLLPAPHHRSLDDDGRFLLLPLRRGARPRGRRARLEHPAGCAPKGLRGCGVGFPAPADCDAHDSVVRHHGTCPERGRALGAHVVSDRGVPSGHDERAAVFQGLRGHGKVHSRAVAHQLAVLWRRRG